MKTAAVVTPSEPPKEVSNKHRGVVYTITSQYLQNPLPVYGGKKNAWWLDDEKLKHAIACFESDMTVGEMLLDVGITMNQWAYFKKLNPQFKDIQESLQNVFGVIAKKTLKKGLGEDANLAWKFLQKTQPERYNKGDTQLPSGVRFSETSFFDEKGNLLAHNKTAQLNHADDTE